MAITSVGYDGSVNETQWAKLIPLVGSSHYGVAGAGDWKVTPHATMDRGVNIATGSGWGHGILDTSDATVSLQGGTVPAGTRWDCVVARRNWSGTGGTTQFQLIPGTGTKQIPSRNTAPGTLDDQPIALVQFTAGQSAPTQIIDLRCWGRNGGMVAKDELALTYLKEAGASVVINGTTWNCVLDTNGNAGWSAGVVQGYVPLFGVGSTLAGGTPGAGQQFLIQAGTFVAKTDNSGYGRVTWPKPFPNGVISVVATDGDDWAGSGSLLVASAGRSDIWGPSGYGGKNDWVYAIKTQPNSDDGVGSYRIGRISNFWHRINWIAIGW